MKSLKIDKKFIPFFAGTLLVFLIFSVVVIIIIILNMVDQYESAMRAKNVVAQNNQSSGLTANSNKQITLPENIFDAEANIPGTAVYISYPSKGFYESGIKFVGEVEEVPSNEFPKQLIIKSQLSIKNYIYFGVDLFAMGLDRAKDGENLETYMDSYYRNLEQNLKLEKERIIKSGGHIQDNGYDMPEKCNFLSINNRDFCVVKSNQGFWWQAFTEQNGVFLLIKMTTYTNSSAYELPHQTEDMRILVSKVWENKDNLFLEILSNLKVK